MYLCPSVSLWRCIYNDFLHTEICQFFFLVTPCFLLRARGIAPMAKRALLAHVPASQREAQDAEASLGLPQPRDLSPGSLEPAERQEWP